MSSTLRRLRWRLRLVLTVRLATLGVTVGAAVLLLLTTVERLYGVTHPFRDSIMPLLVTCAAALVAAAIWPLGNRRIAVSADRRLGLADRLSTASWLAGVTDPSGMGQAQIADTVRHIGLIRPAEAYPLRFDRLPKTALGCLVALLIVQFAPIPPLLLSAREREEQAQLREIAQQIKPAAEKLREQAEKADDEQSREAARRLRTLAQHMERGEIAKREALLELSEVQEKLAAAEQGIKQPSLRTARDAARQIGQHGRESLSRRTDDLARTARERGRTDLEKKLRELAEKARQDQTAEQMRETAAQLAQAERELGLETPLSALLDTASAAIEAGDWQQVASDLAALGEALSGSDRALSAEEAKQLADSLNELAQQLEGTELAQLAQSLQATADAVMDGDLQGAAAALAEAAETGELGHARLAAAVQAAHAGAAAAAASLRAPGAGSAAGGGEGRGVGPDSGSRQGIPPNTPGASLYTPREADVQATPRGVRARMRPGGEMHTAPTRGAPDQVSPSRVPYYEVVGEYSRAAEEALEREEVPPAYRGTVRKYFESLQSGQPAQTSEEQSHE